MPNQIDEDRDARALGAQSFGLKNRLFRILWGIVWFLLASWTQPLHGWRRWLLRQFGATVGRVSMWLHPPGYGIRAT